MRKHYFILAITGLSLFQYFLLLGIRAEHVSTNKAQAIHNEAKKTFSRLVDLIADSRLGLRGSLYWEKDDDTPPPDDGGGYLAADGYPEAVLPKNDEIQDIITYYSQRYQVDPLLISLIINQESGFDPSALSPTGAMGLMQLMPDTAWLLGIDDPFDPEQNIEGGVRYFTQQLDRFNSVELALAAYNAGPKAVENWGGVPPYPETQNYVETIMANYARQSTPSLPTELEEPASEESYSLSENGEVAPEEVGSPASLLKNDPQTLTN